MMALETVTVSASDPGSGGAPGLPVAQNSLRIRPGKDINLVGLFHNRTAAGFTRITSPLLHDSTTGIEVACPAGEQKLVPIINQELETNDTLVLTLSGGTTSAIELTSFNVVYGDLPGVDANFIHADDVFKRAKAWIGVSVSLVQGTTEFGASAAINAIDNQFKSGQEYAILGFTSQSGGSAANSHAIRIRAVDFGNLGVSIPSALFSGSENGHPHYFWDLSKMHDMPLVPVFNADNRDTTLVDAIGADTTTLVGNLILVQLEPKSTASRRR
jgi:hypothetical protein